LLSKRKKYCDYFWIVTIPTELRIQIEGASMYYYTEISRRIKILWQIMRFSNRKE